MTPVLLIFISLLTVFTAFFVGFSRGFDAGYKDHQNDDILRDKVVCRYKDKK